MAVDLKALEGRAFRVDELAQVLELHPDSIRRVIREGRLRAIRPPGTKSYIVLGEDALRFLRGLPVREGDE